MYRVTANQLKLFSYCPLSVYSPRAIIFMCNMTIIYMAVNFNYKLESNYITLYVSHKAEDSVFVIFANINAIDLSYAQYCSTATVGKMKRRD